MRAWGTLIAGTVLFLSTQAHADLTFCNDTGHKIQIAVAYHDANRQPADWVSEGWYDINGGVCRTIFSGDLKDRYYYYYGQTDDGQLTWTGEHLFCISHSSFTIVGKECEPRGYTTYHFNEIDTTDYKSWTQHLHD
jgi:uncharacterized membrane protein